MTETATMKRPLRILSIDDQPTDIAGPLSGLRRTGNLVDKTPAAESAHKRLLSTTYDLLLVDERLEGQNGSELVEEVAAGQVGECNIDLPFAFVTGNPDWLDDKRVTTFDTCLGVKRKGSALALVLQKVVGEARELSPSPMRPPLRRILTRVADWRPENVNQADLIIPSWDSDVTVTVALKSLKGARHMELGRLIGSRWLAWMNLDATSPENIVLTGFELVEEREEEDE